MQIAIINNETWLICGGRDFAMADAWAKRMAIETVPCPADWHQHGLAAGPLRNEDMLINHDPKRVIAFPGGKGTADMVRRAKNRRGRIDVVEIVLPGDGRKVEAGHG